MRHAGHRVIDVSSRGCRIHRRVIQKLKARTASNTCTMVRKQNRTICNIIKLTRQGRSRHQGLGRGRWGNRGGKRKQVFIKDDITGDVDTIGWDVETLVPFMHGTIAEEDTLFGTKLQFATVVGTKVWPTCTAKHFEKGIVWRFME
jgi:hypothetical protein